MEQQHATNNLKRIWICIMMLNVGWVNASTIHHYSYTRCQATAYTKFRNKMYSRLKGERCSANGFDYRSGSETHSITGRR